MKAIFCFVGLFLMGNLFAQQEDLAQNYFDQAEYGKALSIYQKLYQDNPTNLGYLFQMVTIHQELEQYQVAQNLLIKAIDQPNPQFLVELGYNYSLQNDPVLSEKYYDQALVKLEENPIYTNYVADRFRQRGLLDRAIQALEQTIAIQPQPNFLLQLTRFYGEKGEVDKFFQKYLELALVNPVYAGYAKRDFSKYITDNSENPNNQLLKKLLLEKLQEFPDIMWNDFLSWLFVQQNDFAAAFMQEKAIFARQGSTLNPIFQLAELCEDNDQLPLAKRIYVYLVEQSPERGMRLKAQIGQVEVEAKMAKSAEYDPIESRYNKLFEEYGQGSFTVSLGLSYAHFLINYQSDAPRAIEFLKSLIASSNLKGFELAQTQLLLGDALVMEERFNEALVEYSKVQIDMKNSTIAQEAKFKIAQTSFYKGDFEWAESQLKVLKSSTSQRMANDALALKLLISDHTQEDSLHLALKQYAKADLMRVQGRYNEAIALLDTILKNHKTESIVAQTLITQAQLCYLVNDPVKAQNNYLTVLKDFPTGLLSAEACYELAKLYQSEFNDKNNAMKYFEKIIFDYPSSLFFVEARRRFRQLRGDDLN